MKTYYLILFLISFSTLSMAQSSDLVTVSGQVMISADEPAAFSTVMLVDAESGEMLKADATDVDGNFTIAGLKQGQVRLNVSYVGYEEYQSDVIELTRGANVNIGRVQMGAVSEELSEVVVTAKRPMVEVKPDKTIFNVAGSINAQGGNALELLRKAPGVLLDNNDNIMVLGKSGVMVYIDGKPSPLNGADLAGYLRSLDASTIDNIEVITNPSSKYDAQGNAGIVNIVLKKNQAIGTNVTLNAGLGTATHTNYYGGLLLNHRTSKVNYFANYNYSNFEGENWMNFNRYLGSTLFVQDNKILNDRQSHNFKVGADFYADDKQTFGMMINGSISGGDNRNSSRSDIIFDPSTGIVDSILDAKNLIDDQRDNVSINLNYAFNNKKGRTINIDADMGIYKNSSLSNQPNVYLNGSGQIARSVNYASDAETDINIYTLKADAEEPLFKGTLGYGLKFSLVKTDNDFKFYNVDDNGMQVLDMEKSNRFKYDENVNAAYINFQRNFETWSYQFGLRAEHTNSEGILVAANNGDDVKNSRDYFNLFPNVGLTYNVNEKNSMRLSYSRRLNRPSYDDLNPFEFRLDELSFRKGNPFLNPEYTHNVQLGHTYNYSLNTTLSYSRTNDLITRITDTEDGRESFITFENLAFQDALTLSVSYPYSPTEWWNMYFNVSGNYLHNQSEDDGRFTEDKNVDLEATFVSLFGQNTFVLPKGFNLELSGYYNSPGIWGGNFKTQEYWNVDIGVQKKFLEDKLSVKVSVSDVFKSQEWEATNSFGDLRLEGMGGYESRRLRVNLSYNFGNDNIKARKRQTGLEDEKARMNSSGSGPG